MKTFSANMATGNEMICLTPFKELHCGTESIYDWVEPGYRAPAKVLAYLRTREPFITCLSCMSYDNPFKAGERMRDRGTFTDGHFWWHADAWLYASKHQVRLPREFVEYVMSGQGDAFMEMHLPKGWREAFKPRKQ